MTDHNLLKMRKEDKRVKDKKLIQKILDICSVCTLAIHDEPYPYVVPLNYGYNWEDKLTIYLHMASEGYKLSLLEKNPHISCNMHAFVDRSNAEKYRGEQQDYRSVTVFGKAEIITFEQPEGILEGINAIQKHYGRYILDEAPMIPNMVVVKIIADAVTSKAMYPIADEAEVIMPERRQILN